MSGGTRYFFIVDGRLDALNDYINACRIKRVVGANMKKSNQAVVQAAIKQQLRGTHIGKPVSVTCIWYEPNRRRDPDNVAGFGHKVILDALVAEGVIDNDGWANITEIRDIFHVDKDKPRVMVILEEDFAGCL